MMRVAEVFEPGEKVACLTIDFETDYGDRVDGAFNILKHGEELAELSALLAELDVPLSAFIRTDLFDSHPESLDLVRSLARDWHCHSHTHATRGFVSEFEIARTQEAFTAAFGRPALGYRAPLGILYEGDIALLARHGFEFSASVFPTRFPGRFDNRALPTTPFRYQNGIVELPFAVVPRVRSIVSLSFLKLWGLWANRALYRAFGLPPILVFDSHLHDFIYCRESHRQLPLGPRLGWAVNKRAGRRYFAEFVALLRAEGYRILTMTELYRHVLTLPAVAVSGRG